MTHHARSRREWIARFANWLRAASSRRMSLDEALLLARHEYENAFDASPEATAGRLVAWHDDQAVADAAAYSASILIRKVSSPGFRADSRQ